MLAEPWAQAHSLNRSLARWSVVGRCLYSEAVVPSAPRLLLEHSSEQDDMAHPKVYFDVTIGGKPAGRVTMEARRTFLRFLPFFVWRLRDWGPMNKRFLVDDIIKMAIASISRLL